VPARRPMGWCSMRALCCSQGHHIRLDALPLTDAIIRCKWRHPQGTGECGRLLYVLAAVPARDPPGPPDLYFMAEVTWTEAEHIRSHSLGVLDTLVYLDAALREGQNDAGNSDSTGSHSGATAGGADGHSMAQATEVKGLTSRGSRR